MLGERKRPEDVSARNTETDLSADPDSALLAAAAAGDEKAFAGLVERHYDIIYRVVWRVTSGHADTEDMVQEAFLKLWNNPAQVRHGAALRGWLMRVATNLAIDRARRKQASNIDDQPEIAASGPDALDQVLGDRSAHEINSALARLPERQRLALSLVYFESMSNIEAAAALEISVEAVESLLARGRRALKADLKDRWRDLLADIGEISQ
ncbi:sigma-70 family RNA polymerase sigma factor [Taklimakanibacter deserti]|uniref:sigma-70 family RNA polymerase sigma factor n=1 Tax=Taklimakanibacter deserti TaxID=2267839 RepID=UPI000E656D68